MVESARTMTDRAALDRLRDLFRLDPPGVRERISAEFYDYHADLYRHSVPFEIYIEKTLRIRRELGRAERVLDLGAGFGVYACLLRILGIPEVVAFDYQEQKTKGARRLVDYLDPETDRLATVPFCMWCHYRKEMFRRIAEKYSAAEAPAS